MSESDQRFIAMVATKEHQLLDPKNVTQRLRSLFPNMADKIGESPEDQLEECDDINGESFVIPFGSMLVAVLQFRFPIPAETLMPAISNELMWLDGEKEFAKSGAHILVSIVGGNEDPRYSVEKAQNLTYAIAAIIKESTTPLGVYWSTAEVIIEPDRFVKGAVEAGGSEPPTHLWLGYRFFKGNNYNNDQKIVCRTSGLEAFFGREVEVGPSSLQPGALAENVLSIGGYMLTTGEVFSDGHTIGTTEKPEAYISLERSDYGEDQMPIYRLNIIEMA